MAQEFQITRAEQDLLALASHVKAARAEESGFLGQEIESLGGIEKDNLIRRDTTAEKLATLKPAFERSTKGTLTAGNSSSLTDGASALCLISEEQAKRQGREILAFIEAVEFSAVAPEDGLLMAPALALPKLLQKNKLSVADIDIFEIHEAFAAQVLCNLRAWEQGWKRYPELKPIGKIPAEKINVNGGSIALGHPFAATGGRLILSAAYELKRKQQKRAVLSVCAAGAMAAAVLIVRE